MSLQSFNHACSVFVTFAYSYLRYTQAMMSRKTVMQRVIDANNTMYGKLSMGIEGAGVVLRGSSRGVRSLLHMS